ncbi:MAG TPA: riboflavin synthase [Verrucomicrobiae bacterium]|nr:riboflavin synthase [Verrucomicrobiae bacterium]
MFTGIVEVAGQVVRIRSGKHSTELTVRASKIARSLHVGSSVAVNGACLTVVAKSRGALRFDVLNETLERTNLEFVREGFLVNLERPLRADARLDGHFVLGHVDGRGKIRQFDRKGKDYVLDVEAPSSVMRYIVEKGSIAVDGISLTVASVRRNWFRVWIIPLTRKITNLRSCRTGDFVNLEADILGKYVEQLMRKQSRAGR